MPQQLSTSFWSGLNVADPTDFLIRRSHQTIQNGNWRQTVAAESPNLQNVDFVREGISKRKGSALDANLNTILDTNATTVDADSASGQKVLNVAATTGFKVNGQIIINSGGAREETGEIASIQAGVSLTLKVNLTNTHTAVQADAVAQYVFLDGDALVRGVEWISPDTASKIQVLCSALTIYAYISGSWKQLNDSASAPYTHAATVSKCSFAMVDGHLFIGIDGANKIQVYRSGNDLDDKLDNGNTYTEAFGGGSQIVTGAWGTGYYIVAGLHDRLLFANGDSVIQYSDATQPWDRAGGGYYQANSNIVGWASFVPDGGDTLKQYGFIFTEGGIEYISGFDATDVIQQIESAPVAMNHQVIVHAKNWVVYLTNNNEIAAVNGLKVIELGRRFKDPNGITGPLDAISDSSAPALASGFYSADKGQVYFLAPELTNTTNSHIYMLDFRMGEPMSGEPKPQFEERVRLSHWSIKTPESNPWFVSIYSRNGATIGVLASGKIYTMETGNNDLDTLAIEAYYFTSVFNGDMPTIRKKWLRVSIRATPTGNWNMLVDIYLDRSGASSKQFFFKQQSAASALYGVGVYGIAKYSDLGLVAGSSDIHFYSEAIQFRFMNDQASETFVLTNNDLRYLIGAEHR